MKQMKYKSGEKRHKEEAGDGEAVKKVRTAECVDATNRKLAQINLLHNEWRALGGGVYQDLSFFNWCVESRIHDGNVHLSVQRRWM